MDILNYFRSWSDKQKQIFTGSASVLAGAVVLIGYLSSGPSASDYAKAEEVFSDWAAAPNNEELYAKMRTAIGSIPALEKKYESAIAQKLIDTEKLQEALLIAHRSLNRVKSDVPFHAAYAENTLLIEQGLFQKALEKAVSLKEEMGSSFAQEYKGGSLLYAHNLLRIACLQQELKNLPGEKAAWEELEALLVKQGPVAESLLSSFSAAQVNLVQYIAERKKVL